MPSATKLSNPGAAAATGPPGVRKAGRRKGAPNKVTTAFRETIQKLLDANRSNILRWVTEVAEGVPAKFDRKGNCVMAGRAADPATALARIAALADFAAPKLSRIEQTGPDGGALTVVIHKEA